MTLQGNHVPTLNSMGYMTKFLDPYSTEFIEYSKTATSPVADLGVAFGHTTKKLLENKNINIYANDIAQEHLDYLINDITNEEKLRLHAFPGKLPEVFNFEKNVLSGVLASRVLHFLTGAEIEDLAKKVYKSLMPGGVFCAVAETPYTRHTIKFIPDYEERRASGEKWPGFISDFKKYTNRKNTSDWINLLDPDVLSRTFKLAGFKIEKVGFIERPYFPEEVRLDGRESVGIIGRKA